MRKSHFSRVIVSFFLAIGTDRLRTLCTCYIWTYYSFKCTKLNPGSLKYIYIYIYIFFFLFFLIVCFTSYFMFSTAVLPHSPEVFYYHLLLRRKTRIPRVAPFSFLIGILDLFVHRGQNSYTPTAFRKLWTSPGVRCMKHASS